MCAFFARRFVARSGLDLLAESEFLNTTLMKLYLTFHMLTYILAWTMEMFESFPTMKGPTPCWNKCRAKSKGKANGESVWTTTMSQSTSAHFYLYHNHRLCKARRVGCNSNCCTQGHPKRAGCVELCMLAPGAGAYQLELHPENGIPQFFLSPGALD